MWMELLSVFRPGDPMQKMAGEFREMLRIVEEMADIVDPHVFAQDLPIEDQSRIYKLDVKVNKLQRKIRKLVVAHVTLSRDHVPYCLLLMTLVKDAERIGDYWKNISEVHTLGGSVIPEGALRDELADLISTAMTLMGEVGAIIDSQDVERARELIHEGRAAGKRCDKLLVELAKSDFDAAATTAMVLLTRFYKRVGGHLVNILSSVVMPLHKVDFFDEKLSPATETKTTV